MRPRWNVAFAVSALLAMFASAPCLANDNPTSARATGKVTIVYQDDAIQPANRNAIKTIADSGVFERMADRLTKAVALPYDLQIVVTDDLPKGVDDPTTELDGRRVFWPAAFSKETYDILAEFLPEVIRDKGVPRIIAQQHFTADVLNVWSNQFVLGHELGHALIHLLNLPLTGLEEDSADGFATFFTVIDPETGPNAALGAAVLFDAMASKRPQLTLEDFSSDHAVIQQRVYNFLCAALGSSSQRLQSLVTDGYMPELRAMMCGKEWAQLNHGWWTVLDPHLNSNYKKDTEAVRQGARQNLEAENNALFAKFRQMRGQEQPR
jgi:hypothetical protein